MSPRLPLLRVLNAVTAPDAPYSALERWVAVMIASHMDAAGTAWPSMRRLSLATGLGETATRAAVVRLCEGESALFLRTGGGAREGARYEASRYTLRAEVEGFATRGARQTRGSRGEVEGFAWRGRGVRHAKTEEPIEEPIEEPNRIARRKRSSNARREVGSPEAVAVVRAHHETLGGRAEVTAPKLQAAERALRAGFTVDQLRDVFRAVADAPEGGRGLASFCRFTNRAFDYLLRPSTVQGIMDNCAEAVAAAPQGPRPAPMVDWTTRPFAEREAHARAETERLRAAGLVP